ncbi:hypothetical protein [Aliivibrio fischeri]|uniref:hypothetical protein n=1 Tax=Aliivibrio fischeri TaxID=668 RepID=UPI0012DA94DC|nr:hypothetical protein [Aliivibrio fischeri]MUJ26302.1 hypothetical protein [Aliivibrio fischeri]
MALVIDTPTLKSFFESTLVRVATKLNIQDADWKSSHELYSEIANVNGDMYKLLVDFFTAYIAWYNVHVDIDKAGTAGQLTVEQNKALNDACNARDQTRSILIDAYHQI